MDTEARQYFTQFKSIPWSFFHAVLQGIQRDLFFDASEPNYARSAKVMAVLDAINQRYGRQTLKLGSEGFKAPWKMKQNFKSPGYTTNWNELIGVL